MIYCRSGASQSLQDCQQSSQGCQDVFFEAYMIYCRSGGSQRWQSSSGDSRGLRDCWWSSHLCCMGWFLTWASIFFRLLFNVVKGEGFYCIQYLAWVPHNMSYNIISFQNGQAVTLSYRIRFVQKISTCPCPRFSNPRGTRWNIASMSALHKKTLSWMLLYRYPQIMKISLLLFSNGIAGMWTSTRARGKSMVFFSLNLILSLTCFIMVSCWERLGLGWGRKMSLSHWG